MIYLLRKTYSIIIRTCTYLYIAIRQKKTMGQNAYVSIDDCFAKACIYFYGMQIKLYQVCNVSWQHTVILTIITYIRNFLSSFQIFHNHRLSNTKRKWGALIYFILLSFWHFFSFWKRPLYRKFKYLKYNSIFCKRKFEGIHMYICKKNKYITRFFSSFDKSVGFCE